MIEVVGIDMVYEYDIWQLFHKHMLDMRWLTTSEACSIELVMDFAS